MMIQYMHGVRIICTPISVRGVDKNKTKRKLRGKEKFQTQILFYAAVVQLADRLE